MAVVPLAPPLLLLIVPNPPTLFRLRFRDKSPLRLAHSCGLQITLPQPPENPCFERVSFKFLTFL